MDKTVSLRPARLTDLAAVDRLLQRSYPRLLAADYPPSTLVLAMPIITRARPELLTSGRYYLAETAEGQTVSAGGWSVGGPEDGAVSEGMGHIRHFATDPDWLRQGLAGRIMTRARDDATKAGVRWLNCLSTRTAVPFYTAQGFRAVCPVDVALRPGIRFAAIRMLCDLT